MDEHQLRPMQWNELTRAEREALRQMYWWKNTDGIPTNVLQNLERHHHIEGGKVHPATVKALEDAGKLA